MKLKFLLFLSMFFNVAAFATQVEGVVLDQNTKEPIIGASILLRGTSVGTISDIDGKFKINVQDSKTAVLTVSFIGFQKKNVNIDGKTLITVLLEEDTKELDEVVVVGYGQMRKSDLTGSITSVKASDEEVARTTSVDKMLQGKAAGLVVTTGSAAPGGAVSIRIRGTSSLRGDNSPLYVVDGNIISLDEVKDPGGLGTQGGNSSLTVQNPLSQLSPQDIESIEVLKDASATAIYGSQGANGVILITTKKGKSAKPSITLNTTLTGTSIFKQIPVLNSEEYIQFQNAFLLPGETLKTMDGLTPVNWQSEATQIGLSQNHRVSVSGKSNNTNYYFATGYLNNKGVIKKTGINQMDLRLNLEQEISPKLKFQSNTFYSKLNTQMTSGTDKLANVRSSIVRHMISYKPFRTEATSEDFNEDLTTPEAWFTDYDDDSEDTQFNTGLSINYKLIKWLSVQLKGGYVAREKERTLWYGTKLFTGQQANGKAGYSTLNSKSYTTEALLLANKKLGKFNVSGTAGTVYNSKELTRLNIVSENFSVKNLRAAGISLGQMMYPIVLDMEDEQLFSLLSRAVLNYNDKYILTSTFRADASSKFSGDNKWGYFPSFAFAWRANQEEFLKNIEQISNLKIRGGYGMVGNQALPPYQSLLTYNNVFYPNPDGTAVSGVVPSRIANPYLKWEVSEQYNAGFDLSIFKQRINLTVDAYIKNTNDLLLYAPITYISGQSNMWMNKGSIQNKGLEFTLETSPVNKKKIKLDVNATLSINRSKVVKLESLLPGDFGTLKNVIGYAGEKLGNNTNNKFSVNYIMEDYPVGQFVGFATNGILQTDEVARRATEGKTVKGMDGIDMRAGDLNYIDKNDDKIIDANDMTIIGDPNPDFTYSFGTSFSYKRFSVDVNFNGVVGNDIVNANLIDEYDVTNSLKNVRREAFFQAWTPENFSNTFPRLGYPSPIVLTDRLVEDGSYLRLSSLTFSYSFQLSKTRFIKSLSVNTNISNLFCITNYSGFDPDVNTFGNSVDLMGVDLTSYPSSRNLTFGISATF